MVGRPGTVMLRSAFGNVLIRGGGTVLGTHRRGPRRGRAWPAALLIGLINGAFGVVIIILEVQLH
jgi:hypothetical protein